MKRVVLYLLLICKHVYSYTCPSLPTKPPGSACNTSAVCTFDHFCHPELKTCEPFCRASSQRPPDDLVPRPEDVWIVSYPKSGSTWLRHLIWNVYRFETGLQDRPSTFSEVDEGIPFLEDRISGPIREIFRNKAAPRIFKSHQPYNCDVSPCRGWVVSRQAQWQCQCPNCASRFRRVIYVVRDGRPAMVSYWKFQGQLGLRGFRDRFDDYLSLEQRIYPGVAWSDHVRSWMGAPKERVDILWVKYEEMMSNASSILRRVATWLDIPHSAESIAWSVRASSAKTMSQTEGATGSGLFSKRYRHRDDDFRLVHMTSAGTTSPVHKTPWQRQFVRSTDTTSQQSPESNTRVFLRDHGYMLGCLGYPATPS